MTEHRYLINNEDDRRAMVTALATAGYSVKVIEDKSPVSHHNDKFWVVVVDEEGE